MRTICILAAVAAVPLALQAAPPRYDHIVVVIEENHGYSDIIGSSAAPYINNTLAAEGAVFANFYAFLHTSAANYGEVYSGDANSISDYNLPPELPLTTPNLGAALRAAGYSFAGYSEDLPEVGSTVWSSGGYVRRHNPWVNWQDDSDNPAPHTIPGTTNLPMSSFPSDFSLLPSVAMVVPNLANDMHDGSDPTRITKADTWIKDNLDSYYQWAKTHNSLLIVTADEDSQKAGSYNRVPTVIAGAGVAHAVNNSSYTLHNLLRTLEEPFGAAPSGAAQYVRPIAGIFAPDPPSAILTLRNGQGSYAGAVDTLVREDQAGTSFGSVATLAVTSASGASQHALVRFDGLVGSAAEQLPPGATILSAKLILRTTASTGTKVEAHRMLVDWTGNSTWASLSGGVAADGVEAQTAPDFAGTPAVSNHPYFFDVSDSVQAFADGTANHGWAILPTGGDDYQFASSETATQANRPGLEITYALAPRFKAQSSGTWDDASDWYNGVPDGPGAFAYFPPARLGRIFVNGTRTVGQLTFEKENRNDFVPGTAPLLAFDSGSTAPAQLNASGGAHRFGIPVHFAGDVEIFAPRSQITLSGPVTWGDAAVVGVRNGQVNFGNGAAQAAPVAGVLRIDPGAAVRITEAGGPFSHAGSRTRIVNNAAFAVAAGVQNAAEVEGAGDTTVSGNSSFTVTHLRQNSLTLLDTATVHIRPDGGEEGLSTLHALSIGQGATLDLADNDLVLFYTGDSPVSQVQQWVASGIQSGHGLVTSVGDDLSVSQSGRVLAVFDNHDAHFTSIDGLSLPDLNQVIVKYTYLGDANADGKVDPTDYAVVDGKIGLGDSWITGDLNLDGKVDPSDYAQIDGNQGAGLGGAGGPQLALAVPEPSGLALLLGSVALLRRRRV